MRGYLAGIGQAPLLVWQVGVNGVVQPLRLLPLPLAPLQQNLLACTCTVLMLVNVLYMHISYVYLSAPMAPWPR